MSSPMAHEERRREVEAREKRAAKERVRQFEADVREVFGTTAGRRLLHGFLADSMFEKSPLRFDAHGHGDASATSHAIGWQDAARWWLAAVRDNCPEREAQMHKEANEALKREIAALTHDESTETHDD